MQTPLLTSVEPFRLSEFSTSQRAAVNGNLLLLPSLPHGGRGLCASSLRSSPFCSAAKCANDNRTLNHRLKSAAANERASSRTSRALGPQSPLELRCEVALW